MSPFVPHLLAMLINRKSKNFRYKLKCRKCVYNHLRGYYDDADYTYKFVSICEAPFTDTSVPIGGIEINLEAYPICLETRLDCLNQGDYYEHDTET
jgi:hypothetical protein